MSLYNPNVAIYAVNINEALNARSVIKYMFSQPIFLEIRRIDENKVSCVLKNRFGREIFWEYYDNEYDKLKENVLYSIQQIKEYRQKLKLEDIEKDFE